MCKEQKNEERSLLPLGNEIDEIIKEMKRATPVNKEELHQVTDKELTALVKENRRLRSVIDIAADRILNTLHHLLDKGVHHEATKLVFYIEIPLTERAVVKPVLSYKVERDS